MAPFPKATDAWHYCSLLSPIVALTVNLIIQVMMVRTRKGAHFLRSIIEGLLAGAVALACAELILLAWRGGAGDALVTALLVNVPTYAALSYCYFGVANFGQTSIRVRIYSEILSARGGLEVREIERMYDAEAMRTMRLKRLIESGDIIERDGRYFIGRTRLVFIANILVAAKHVLLKPSTGMVSKR